MEYDEIVHRLAREFDVGKDIESVMVACGRDYGSTFGEASMDLWKVLIDKTQAEAYDNFKTITQGQGLQAYGVVYRWFTDVSGFGLAERAMGLTHPDPLREEEELAKT